MARTITLAERELDRKLAAFGLGDQPATGDLGNKADSGEMPPADDSLPGDEGLQDEGRSQDDQHDEGVEDQGQPQAQGDRRSEDRSDKQVNHNWEKRAKDNQRSYFREKALREESEKRYQAEIADLEARLRAATRGFEEDEEDQRLAEASPEAAEFIRRREAKRAEQEVEAVTDSMQAAFKRTLTAIVPNWQEIIATPEFKQWKAEQPKSTRRVMEQTFNLDQDGSFLYEPSDVVNVLKSFGTREKGYVPQSPEDGQAQPVRPNKGNTPSGDAMPDVFTIEEMNDPNLADKFMRTHGRDRKAASEAFDKKFWRSNTYWQKQGYTSA